MKSFLRRCLALVLVLSMAFAGGVEAFAASADFDGVIELDIENAIIADPSANYENIKDVIANAEQKFEGANKDTEVTFIVELEGESVLEAKSASESALEFMTSFKGNKTLNSIASEQAAVENRIKVNNSFKLEVEASYKVIMNGLAVRGSYAAKNFLENLPGVKAVYVSNTYDVPVTFDDYNFADITSGGMIDSDSANANGYTGKGAVTAILDTGLDINHEAFANAPEAPAFDLSHIEEAVASGNLFAGYLASAEDLYVSEKVPFAFNYADYIADVTDREQHGTHVAGTVGADCEAFSGVAPDTQIIVMKVFGDTQSATDAVIFSALEDAVVLGVDAINMSLGAPGGFTYENEETDAVYSAIKEAGINLMVSAGNENNSITDTESPYGLALATQPDTGIVGSPSTYDAPLSVASVNEYANFISYIMSNGQQICYNDSNIETPLDFVANFDGQTVEYVPVPGFGDVADYECIDVTGKLALVSRGTLDFTAKEANAAAAGAIGIVVYDNVVGDRINMMSNNQIPAIFVTKADGEFLLAQEEKTISVSSENKTFAAVSDGGLMSTFSSIGPAPDLSIKPEITAPGGYVYSTLPGGVYGSMSGTSMAAPHMTGAAAVMQQYVDEAFAGYSETAKRELINTLIMNTAIPVQDEYGVEYAVRKQGAGLAQINNAINTKAYVTVDGCERPKAELGDSAEGVYTIDLTVHNFGSEELTYNMNAIPLTSELTSDGVDIYMLEYQYVMPEGEMIVEFTNDVITVPAGGEASVSVTLTLTEDEKEFLDNYCYNGTFMEGFIVFESANADGIDLSVPYLGFYGDWGAAPIFDATVFDDELASAYTGAMVALNAAGNGFYLGMNKFTGAVAEEKIAASAYMTMGGYYPTAIYGLLRAPKTLTYTITNEDGNAIDIFSANGNYLEYYGPEVTFENVIKSFYYSKGGFINNMAGPTYEGWMPIEFGPDGKLYYIDEGQYYLNATAKVDGTDSPAGTQNHTYPIFFDNTAPEIFGTRYDNVNGNHYVSIALYDNHYVMGLQILSADGTREITEIVTLDDVVTEAGTICSITFDVTDFVNEGIDSAVLVAYDYAQNEYESYEFSLVHNTPEAASIDLLAEKNIAYILGQESFEVEAEVTVVADNIYEENITWTSSDESIATVEATGEVVYDAETGAAYYKAIVSTHDGKGMVTITATTSNGLSDSYSFYVYGGTVYGGGIIEYPNGRPSEPSVPSEPSEGCDHEWSAWEYKDGFMKRTCANCGITDLAAASERTEEESNPNTGAPVSAIGAIAVLAAAAFVLKK